MKKLINDPSNVVHDSLVGVAAAHPDLHVDFDSRVVFRGQMIQGKVGIVSGGGSGHEPLHGGFVGTGMLDAAVAGEVFTSPTPDQILTAINGVETGAGSLLIVKNYTGDVMNFQMAAEMAESNVAQVIVNDDVAVQDSLYTAGRRGVGLTVFVEKIAGAAAEAGKSLAEVTRIAQEVIDNGRSMGVGLTAVTLPAVGHPNFDLPDDEIEMGIGIHGEPGRERLAQQDAHSIAQRLVTAVCDDLDFTQSPAIVMLNGMGATPLIELYLMYGEVAKLLQERGVNVVRHLVGNYVTSIDMAGCSLTVLRATDEMLQMWDAPVVTPALTWGAVRLLVPSDGKAATSAAPSMPMSGKGGEVPQAAVPTPQASAVDAGDTGDITVTKLVEWINKTAHVMSENEAYLTDLDAQIGDADHGTNMARGMAAAVAKLDESKPSTVAGFGKTVGMALVSSVGGASGPLYGTFFLKFGQSAGEVAAIGVKELAQAVASGVQGVKQRGKAEIGDKTLIDVLEPVATTLETGDIASVAEVAASQREATADLVARKGRASYLGQRSVGHVDPGSASAALLIQALVESV